ncbi:MAG: hypothetical protein JWP97_5766 [Labilithrix sp.]|nr:hypothetical protein [Labilithrix sp.]
MLPNPIIGGYPYNWYESIFKFDALSVEGVLSVSGIKPKVEQSPQYGTGRLALAIATGKVELEPITVSMYLFAWTPVKAMLMAKSLGRGLAFAEFAFTAMATGNPLAGAPPVGDVFSQCKISEVGKEYGQDVNGLKIDVVFQPLRHRDIDGVAMVTSL